MFSIALKIENCSFEWENFMNGETVLMIKLEWSTKFVIKFPGDGSSTEMFNYIHFKQNTHILMCIFCQIERQHSVGGIKFNLDKSKCILYIHHNFILAIYFILQGKTRLNYFHKIYLTLIISLFINYSYRIKSKILMKWFNFITHPSKWFKMTSNR